MSWQLALGLAAGWCAAATVAAFYVARFIKAGSGEDSLAEEWAQTRQAYADACRKHRGQGVAAHAVHHACHAKLRAELS